MRRALIQPGRLTLAANRFRVSVSVFNDMHDIERLLAVLGHA